MSPKFTEYKCIRNKNLIINRSSHLLALFLSSIYITGSAEKKRRRLAPYQLETPETNNNGPRNPAPNCRTQRTFPLVSEVAQ